MKTIKLPIQNKIDVTRLQEQFNSILRFSYNRFLDGKTEKEIRLLSKSLNNIDLLDSWFIQCAIKEAQAIHNKSGNDKVVFGGKKLYRDYNKGLIDKVEFLERRLLPISIQGESPQKGNRKFLLDLKNNKIIFKVNRKNHIEIDFPNLKQNYHSELMILEAMARCKQLPFQVRINNKFIWIIFDETKINIKNNKSFVKDRIASIDLNPNYVGFVIKDREKILYKEVVSIKKLNDQYFKLKGLPSSHKLKIKLNNKRNHEIFEINKHLVNLANHYNVEVFAIEDLNMKCKDNKLGRNFNRLVNNMWNRSKLEKNLEKRLNEAGIKLLKIQPQYSSFIGCMNHPKDIDSISAALEIGRRCLKLINYKKGDKVIYPKFDKLELLNHWKDEVVRGFIKSSSGWIDLYRSLKKSKVKYRFLFDEAFSSKSFQLKSYKSFINLYSFV